jgi:phospholipase/carboxylesterase
MIPRFPENFWSERCDSGALDLPEGESSILRPHIDWDRVPAVSQEPAESETVPLAPNPAIFGRDVCVYVPQSYEPNYAYPLIVWLHGDGGSEDDLAEVMPQISEQNYLGLSFRGPLPAKGELPRGFRWLHSSRAVTDFLGSMHETVCLFRREYHIHSERIFLAGFGGGATLAVQLLLGRPEWFGGAIALGGRFSVDQLPLARFRDLGGKTVLVGAGARDSQVSIAEAMGAGRLLHSAGMNVTTRLYEGGHELTPEILGYVNHWLMDGIYAAV